FFQAEDGIRDFHVTGVQTCALPICPPGRRGARRQSVRPKPRGRRRRVRRAPPRRARRGNGVKAAISGRVPMTTSRQVDSMIARTCIAVIALVLLGGCAVRIGGPGPVEYRTVALSTGHGTAPDEVARWIRDANANVVLLSAAADSAWFDAVARQTRMTLSGPGRAGASSLAFLAHEALGDTTVALNLASGDEIVIHDALYRIDKHRYLDLIALRVDP